MGGAPGHACASRRPLLLRRVPFDAALGEAYRRIWSDTPPHFTALQQSDGAPFRGRSICRGEKVSETIPTDDQGRVRTRPPSHASGSRGPGASHLRTRLVAGRTGRGHCDFGGGYRKAAPRARRRASGHARRAKSRLAAVVDNDPQLLQTHTFYDHPENRVAEELVDGRVVGPLTPDGLYS